MYTKNILSGIFWIMGIVSLSAQNYVKLDFTTNDITAPLYKYWATPPCYIERVDECLEFYYNQAAFDADQVRKRKGAELRWDYKTYTEAWYGFRFFLPEGKFPKDAVETHIAQAFQFGGCNSWAGLLSIEKQDLWVAHRSSCGNPTKARVKANIPWNTWISVVLHFKVSKNNTGMFQVWINDDPKEFPSYNARNINFGFGEWDNNTTLAEGNDIGGKWGMYCWEGGDRTMRFDDLAILSGSDEQGFEKVNPQISAFSIYTSESGKVKIYPGIVENTIHIDLAENTNENAEMCVYDLSGKILLIQKLELLKNAVDLQCISAGNYILKVRMDKGLEEQKMIIKK